MNVEMLTKKDLQDCLMEFRQQLMKDLKNTLNEGGHTKTEWLKSNEVKKILGISTGTLQNLRITGKLNPSKIGGIHYYKFSEIESLFNDKKR